MDKVDSMQEQMGSASKEMQTKKKSKRNARHQKHCAEIKWLYQIIKQDIAKKGITELKEFSIETAKTERKKHQKPEN